MTREEVRKRNIEIVQLRQEGWSMSQLAEKYGVTHGCIHHVCKANGVAGAISKRRACDGMTKEEWSSHVKGYMTKTYEEAKEYIDSFGIPFEYVGGYTGSDSTITLRCKKCGYEFQHGVTSIRHGKVPTCKHCEELKKEEAKRAKEAQREAERKAREAEANRYRPEKFRVCAECGQVFTASARSKFCCVECARRYSSRMRKDKRYKRMERDRSITVRALYERDNGICWICGKKCDLNDRKTRRDGTVVCGENYPSVDHIKPVCEGGKDRWDNVRLAHRRCNSLRYVRERFQATPHRSENAPGCF